MTGIGQGAKARVPTSRPLVTSRSSTIEAALRALLIEAKSGQHRMDRQNMKCQAMEAAIVQAEEALRR